MTNTKPAKSFQDLIVWQKAYKFVLSVYLFSEKFPKAEKSGLTFQLRQAAISIPANIAEGFEKQTSADKVRLTKIAEDSIEKCHNYLILAKDLGYGDIKELMFQLEQISKLITAYYISVLTSNS